jgi:SAM-dependent methyltransferase
LLDLGCGPGRLALALAGWFAEVWAVDWEPEMVDVGRREADRLGVGNVRWLVGRAEDLEAEPASFELVVIGEAFHRMDQLRVASQVREWLVPGGCVAIGGCFTLSGPEPWKGVLRRVVDGWLAERVPPERQVAGVPAGSGPEHSIRVLERLGFGDVVSRSFSEPLEWSVESLLGCLFSMSRCSRRVLGDTVEAFEAEIRDVLLAHEPSSRFVEELRCGYTLGRKPGGA